MMMMTTTKRINGISENLRYVVDTNDTSEPIII